MDPDREIIVFSLVCFVILGLFITAVCGCITISRKRKEALCINPATCCDGSNNLVNANLQSIHNQPSSYMNWYTPNMAVAQNTWPKYEHNRSNYMTDANWIYNTNHMDNDCLNAALLPHGQSFVYP